MTCAEIHDLLLDYLRRQLTPQIAFEIREHLDACHACLNCLELERNYLALVEGVLRRQRCPSHLRAQILSALFSPR